MRRTAVFAILAVAGFALAAVIITNVAEWSVIAAESPVPKLGNASIAPLATSYWSLSNGLNVTSYTLRFVPGWEEAYDVGTLDSRVPGLQAYLQREAQLGTATYTISLGGQPQISDAQASGPPVALPARLTWRTTASQPYWVLATARFQVGGAKAQQFINFSATPMSLLSTASRSCTAVTKYDDFSGACTPVQYSFDLSVSNNRTYVSGGSTVYLDISNGNPKPSLYTESKSGYASFFIDYSQQPFGASASFSFQYSFKASLQDADYIQVHFFIDTTMDGQPDLEVIYYGSGGGTKPYPMAPVIYGRSLPAVARLMPGFANKQNVWTTITISQVYNTGRVVGLAFTAYSGSGVVKAWWDNVGFTRCAAPSYLGAYTRGSEYTVVYVDDVRSPSTPPSVATEADAYNSTGNPASDYGVAAAIYDVTGWGTVQAAGFSFAVRGLYLRNATDPQDNVAYVSVGVDSDGDGLVDTEYIFYRYDTLQGPGVVVSVLASPGTVVCTVDSAGSCTPSSASFRVYSLGGMSSGYTYWWNGSLPASQPGVVRAVAFAVTDASYWSPGTASDVWVWWDDFSATYIGCTPLPPEWGVSGDTYYRQLVPGAVVYAGSFAGDGGFYLFDSGLNPILGG
ncbi:MAG: hypothetical protein ABWK01_05005, partial [Infirmifilum sp.]